MRTRFRAASTLVATALVASLAAAPAASVPTPGPLAAGDPGPSVTVDIFSDIQGHLDDWDRVLTDAAQASPDSVATVINGDIVDRGYAFEYDGVVDVMERHDRDQPLLATFGNHEAYAGAWCDPQTLCQPSWPNQFTPADFYDTFFDFTGAEKVYTEQVVDGVAMLALGPETLGWWEDPNLDDHVYLSDEQLDWLRDRMAHHGRSGRPILVFAHYPLQDTVTQSFQGAGEYHLQDEELRGILGDYPQAVMFSGHTHADISQDWWAARVQVPGGHPDGFTAVDTGAVLNHQYIQATADADGTTLRARDARSGEVINELLVPSVDPRAVADVAHLDVEADVVAPGGAINLTGSVLHAGARARSDVRLTVELPEGWQRSSGPEPALLGRLGPNERGTAEWTVTAPADAAAGPHPVQVTARDRSGAVVATASTDVEVAAAPDGVVAVSTLPFLAEQNHLGPVERDRTNGGLGRGDGGPLSIAGNRYDTGLGMLAPASAAVHLGGVCTRFAATVGLDDAAPQGLQRRPLPVGDDGGDVVFVVEADGAEVFRSEVLRQGEATDVDVAVSGADLLRLRVEDADGDSSWDYADWGDARLTCG